MRTALWLCFWAAVLTVLFLPALFLPTLLLPGTAVGKARAAEPCPVGEAAPPRTLLRADLILAPDMEEEA